MVLRHLKHNEIDMDGLKCTIRLLFLYNKKMFEAYFNNVKIFQTE